ncbi:hypothetical protein P9112_011455 [Eukaryota sp. TZLM1-RC]
MPDPSILTPYFDAVQSVNAELRKPAEEQLIAFQKQSGFLPLLLNYIADSRFTINQRILACSSAKLTVLREWRSGPTGAIQPEDKQCTKTLLPQLFNHTDRLLCENIADLAGKLMRKESLRSFPDLPGILLNQATTLFGEGKDGICPLIGLHSVISELSTMCLATDRRLYYQLATVLAPELTNLISHLIPITNPDSPGDKYNPVVISLQSLSKLIDSGLSGSDSADVPSILKQIADLCVKLLSTVQIRKGKLSSMLLEHVFSVLQSIFSQSQAVIEPFFKNLLVFGLQIISSWPNLDNLLYNSVLTFFGEVVTAKSRLTSNTRSELDSIITKDLLKDLFTHFSSTSLSPFFDPDLSEMIDYEPDEFHVVSLHDPPLFISSAKTFISVLFTEYGKLCKEVLFELLNTQLSQPLNNIENIKKIDGMLELFSISANSFFGKEAQSLIPSLTSILSLSAHESIIIRRRICLLISSFSFVVADNTDFLTIIFKLFTDSSLIVKFAAWEALHSLLTEFKCIKTQSDLINQAAEELLTQISKTIPELTSDDLMKLSCSLITDLILILQANVVRFLELIHSLIPVFWSRLALRSDLLCLLKGIVYIIGPNSVSLWPTALSLVEPIFAASAPDSSLLHDCLLLYLALLRNSPHSNQDLPLLLSLIKHLPKLVSLEVCYLPLYMQILFSGVLLGGQSMCVEYSSIFGNILGSTVDVVSDRAMIMTLAAYDIILLHASEAVFNSNQKPFIDIFTVVVNAGQGDIEDLSAALIGGYAALGCRILQSNPGLFWKILGLLNNGLAEEKNFLFFIAASIEYHDVLLDYHKQKMVAASCLFALENDETGAVIQNLPAIINLIIGLLSHHFDPLKEVWTAEMFGDGDLLDEDEYMSDQKVVENDRRSNLISLDPVINLDLKQYAKESLSKAVNKFPGIFERVKAGINEKDWNSIMN